MFHYKCRLSQNLAISMGHFCDIYWIWWWWMGLDFFWMWRWGFLFFPSRWDLMVFAARISDLQPHGPCYFFDQLHSTYTFSKVGTYLQPHLFTFMFRIYLLFATNILPKHNMCWTHVSCILLIYYTHTHFFLIAICYPYATQRRSFFFTP